MNDIQRSLAQQALVRPREGRWILMPSEEVVGYEPGKVAPASHRI